MFEISKLKINFHLFEKCNMHCFFCYRDKSKNFNIRTFDQYKKIIDRLYELGFRQINFAGGEPTLFNELDKLLKYSQELGIVNSIISNGFIEDKNQLEKNVEKILDYVDVYGLSIDSLDEQININSGRTSVKKECVNLDDIFRIYTCTKNKNKKFKINTVVNNLNKNDKSLLKIFDKDIKIYRWKIMRVHPSPNVNIQKNYVTDEEFLNFVNMIKSKFPNVCVEDENDMINSYIMIDGDGNLSVDSTTKTSNKINIFESTDLDIVNFLKNNLDEQKYSKRYQ